MADELLRAITEAKEKARERKFLESLEIAINMKDIDLSDPKNRINEEIVLPKGRGKDVKIGVFGTEETQFKVKGVADYIYGPEDLNKFGEDKKGFKKITSGIDYFLADVALMGTIGKSLGQVLGPRGKIPKPLPRGQDPVPIINNLRKTVRARSKDKKTFHVPIGTRDMKDEDLAENVGAVIKRITGKLDKGIGNIESLFVKTTMGKAVKVEVTKLS
ncbi:MAG: 50S ribosomal protein L1 [Candidatus Thermoplasmatota archaeon]|nr:50S ribosomal protein L1 [Candidatus Thermoplasmatota archaeon]